MIDHPHALGVTGSLTVAPFQPETDGWSSRAPVTVLIGPPGTGKTASILSSWLLPCLAEYDAADILACSFTRAAAGVMRERLASATGLDTDSLRRTCSTIHSEGFRLLRLDKPHVAPWDEKQRKAKPTAATLGQGADGAVAAREEDIESPWEQLARPCPELRPEAIRVWSLARNVCPIEALEARAASSSAGLLRCVTRALSRTESDFGPDELAAEAAAYEADKASVGGIDFTDMLLDALDISPPHRELLIIDEAQDLSNLQVLLIERWAESADHLVWVGDPDQGIYEFAGADGQHLTGLVRAGAAEDKILVRGLHRSWRVPAAAHTLARQLILRNRLRVDAPYQSADKAGAVVEVVSDALAVQVAADAAEQGQGRQDNASTNASACNVFVLARSVRALAPYAQEMELAGIPFTHERGSSPMGQGRLVNLVLCIQAVLDGHLVGKEQLRAFVDAIPGRPRSSFLRGPKKTAQAAVKQLADGQCVPSRDLSPFGLDGDEIRSCGALTAALESIHRLGACTPQLRILARCGPPGLRKEPRIALTTMHGAKGREADLVVADLTAPYPVTLALHRGDQASIEAERRVLYVALTRTKDRLVLVRGEEDLGVLLGL